MLCLPRILSETLPEIHKTEKSDFLKPIIQSQIIKLSVYNQKHIPRHQSKSVRRS